MTCSVALLMPATSPGEASIISVANPRRSPQRRYMRSSISAQSCASVPPDPAWMSRKAFAASISRENMRPQFQAHERRIPALEVLLHRAEHGQVFLIAGHFEQLRGIFEPTAHRRNDVHEIGQRRPLPAERARVLRVVSRLPALPGGD